MLCCVCRASKTSWTTLRLQLRPVDSFWRKATRRGRGNSKLMLTTLWLKLRYYDLLWLLLTMLWLKLTTIWPTESRWTLSIVSQTVGHNLLFRKFSHRNISSRWSSQLIDCKMCSFSDLFTLFYCLFWLWWFNMIESVLRCFQFYALDTTTVKWPSDINNTMDTKPSRRRRPQTVSLRAP